MGATWALFLVLAFPWSKELWQEVSGVTRPIWDDNPEPTFGMALTDEEREEVQDFVRRVQAASGKEAAESIFGCRSKAHTKKEADRRARKIVQTWQKNLFVKGKWKVSKIVGDYLVENNYDYWGQLNGSRTPRDLDSASRALSATSMCYVVAQPLLEKLVDEHEYIGKSIPPATEQEWLITLLSIVYSGQKSTVKRTLNKIQALEKRIEKDERSLRTDLSLTKGGVTKLLNSIASGSKQLLEYRMRTRNEEDARRNATLAGTLGDIQSSLAGQRSGNIPPAVHRLIYQVVDTSAFLGIESAINETLERYRQGDSNTQFLPAERSIIPDWNLDDELKHLTVKNTQQLWTDLGIKDEKLVPLAEWRDPYLQFNSWQNPDECPEERRIPSNLKWHQVVGLHRFAESMFTGTSVLNMDEVGVGKTLQVIALIAYRIMSIQALDHGGEYLGRFKNLKPGTLKDGAVLIIVPPTLLNQWSDEMQRWFKYGAVDLVKYEGSYDHDARKQWWKAFGERSSKMYQRVILTTRQALFADADAALMEKTTDIKKSYLPTLYHAEIGFYVADEIHDIRNAGKRLNAYIALSSHVGYAILLTATPMVTRPQDLLNIGKIMRISACNDEAIAREFARKIAAGKRADKKRRKAEKDDQSAVTVERAQGKVPSDSEEPSALEEVIRECIERLKKIFKSYAMRRTIQSPDYDGRPIWGADPPLDIFVFLKPNGRETEKIEELAAEAMVVSMEGWETKFYLGVRKILTHPDYYEWDRIQDTTDERRVAWQGPASLEEYQANPSTKIDATVEIIRHHLQNAGAAPLGNKWPDGDSITKIDPLWQVYTNDLVPRRKIFVDRFAPSLSPSTKPTETAPAPAESASAAMPSETGATSPKCYEADPAAEPLWDTDTPDKHVVYVFFAAQQLLLKKVLEWHGIKALTLSGGMSPGKRAQTLREFREAAVPMVLIVTSVSIVGLNLDCANIVTFLSTMWSGQDDRQFIGRVWRNPQVKPVLVYRPLAMETNEKNMSNIAFGKEEMHRAFITPTAIEKALAEVMVQVNENEDAEDAVEAGGKKTRAKKAKKSPAVKAAAAGGDRPAASAESSKAAGRKKASQTKPSTEEQAAGGDQIATSPQVAPEGDQAGSPALGRQTTLPEHDPSDRSMLTPPSAVIPEREAVATGGHSTVGQSGEREAVDIGEQEVAATGDHSTPAKEQGPSSNESRAPNEPIVASDSSTSRLRPAAPAQEDVERRPEQSLFPPAKPPLHVYKRLNIAKAGPTVLTLQREESPEESLALKMGRLASPSQPAARHQRATTIPARVVETPDVNMEVEDDIQPFDTPEVDMHPSVEDIDSEHFTSSSLSSISSEPPPPKKVRLGDPASATRTVGGSDAFGGASAAVQLQPRHKPVAVRPEVGFSRLPEVGSTRRHPEGSRPAEEASTSGEARADTVLKTKAIKAARTAKARAAKAARQTKNATVVAESEPEPAEPTTAPAKNKGKGRAE
ncbi:uncharacterized protein PHACADRAFT_201655 [Phanerochaete carnosa HHB-10118-sp]|uniref:Helicase ATP-binding domain-containing protein n=1 Tax=Phanerochaete carnosa (strain HHB-10118-sp) TaxID=650164 RepID=K5UIQ4_PHACS|nr:uncharacterized protein PHACADRAFT_201655 [Phanerochaete carnosa HHB-10118-sp]EKM49396.1 hypothetical protein PHACADRAFT_201655 [Phanerochaete carnosa HHB-10118-sp]